MKTTSGISSMLGRRAASCVVSLSLAPEGPMEYLTYELGHDLLGEDLQLPLDDGQRGEALLDPPDQIAGIAGLDHL